MILQPIICQDLKAFKALFSDSADESNWVYFISLLGQAEVFGLFFLNNSLPLLICLIPAIWSSGKAFVSRAGSFRFKFRARHIEQNDVNDFPPLLHFFEKNYVAEMDVYDVCYYAYAAA